MREHEQPVTETMTATKARRNWNRILNVVAEGKSRVLVEENGVGVAALVSPDDLARLERMDADRAERLAVVDRMRAAFQDVPEDQLARDVSRVIAEVRAEARGEEAQQRAASAP